MCGWNLTKSILDGGWNLGPGRGCEGIIKSQARLEQVRYRGQQVPSRIFLAEDPASFRLLLPSAVQRRNLPRGR